MDFSIRKKKKKRSAIFNEYPLFQKLYSDLKNRVIPS